LEAQRSLVTEFPPQSDGALHVRMALHTTAAEPHDGDYLAPGLNRLARLLAAAHGGQALVSLATQELARDTLPAGLSLRDLGEHPLRDLYRPERVFQLIHPDLPADFPPLQSLATRPNNLPLQPTPFLGREEQVAGVVALLRREDVRLLTVTGPGGVGKTRLALQAAADVLEVFPDGVWFVDLSSLNDPSLVLPAIGAVLGLREGGTSEDRVAGALAGKRILLVLDNFERVLDAAPVVAGLLARAPESNVLVTSRMPLRAYGEQEYPLSPLPLPDPVHLPHIDTLSQYEAVRLFVARARAVKPEFAVTNANAPAVAEICSRLDGLPLAIELAAACVKVLPPQALLKRLEKRLPLLTGGARTAPARQQTMRGAIAWSRDLLSPAEQALFARLAVFPGGCTLEAAEAVASRDGEPDIDIYAGVAALVDKSLLRQEEGAEGEPRFRMLETVREYALETLEACGETEDARGRLAQWCLALSEAAEPPFPGDAMDPAWVRRIDDEVANLRASIGWLLEWGCAAEALHLLAGVQDYWGNRLMHTVDLVAWMRAALAAAPDAPVRDRALAHHTLTWANAFLGNHAEALAQAQAAVDAARESGDAAIEGLAQTDVAMAWEHAGDVERAADAYAEAERLLREVGSESMAAWALAELGDKLVLLGDLERAVPMLEAAIPRLEQAGNAWGVAMALGERGYAALAQGDIALAARSFAESIAAAERNAGDRRSALGAVVGLAGVAATIGEAERAARIMGGVEAAWKRYGIVRPAHALHLDGIVAAVRTALDAETLGTAWTAGRALTMEETIVEALTPAAAVEASARG
jgi:predicted ATPase